MANIFDSIFVKKPGSSKQSLNYTNKFNTNFGKIVPILVEDILPGDKLRPSSEVFLRFQPMLAPIMSKVNVRVDYFFVPYRLLWDNWSKFISPNSGLVGQYQQSTPIIPTIPHQAFKSQNSRGKYYGDNVGSLADFLRLAPSIKNGDGTYTYSVWGPNDDTVAFPFAAYNLIWNEYYRNQSLQDELPYKLTDGVNNDSAFTNTCNFHYRNWKRDYFTAALPWPQKATAQIQIPMGNSAEVKLKTPAQSGQSIGIQKLVDPYGTEINNTQNRVTSLNVGQVDSSNHPVNAGSNLMASHSDGNSQNQGVWSAEYANLDPNGTMYADLSNASGVTINELRRLTKVQQFLEVAARAGSRYKEQILALFGVKTPDYRLDRPEYLGGNVAPVIVSEVLQQSQTTQDSPLGQYSGHGVMSAFNTSKKFFAEEHGILMGLMSIQPITEYNQGCAKYTQKRDITDFFFPQFEHIGEQVIKQYEIYAYNSQQIDYDFGYIPRYAEYKFHPNEVHGELATNLQFWHLGRQFSTPPTLSSQFVGMENSASSLQRIFAVQEDTDNNILDNIVVMVNNHQPMKRKMSRFSIPSL